VGEINVPQHNWKAWPSVPTASTVPTLLNVSVVSGKPLVIACTATGDELTTRTKAANSELSLFFFGVIGIPFYTLFSRFWRTFGPKTYAGLFHMKVQRGDLSPLLKGRNCLCEIHRSYRVVSLSGVLVQSTVLW
jgi:hypothetical protein